MLHSKRKLYRYVNHHGCYKSFPPYHGENVTTFTFINRSSSFSKLVLPLMSVRWIWETNVAFKCFYFMLKFLNYHKLDHKNHQSWSIKMIRNNQRAWSSTISLMISLLLYSSHTQLVTGRQNKKGILCHKIADILKTS